MLTESASIPAHWVFRFRAIPCRAIVTIAGHRGFLSVRRVGSRLGVCYFPHVAQLCRRVHPVSQLRQTPNDLHTNTDVSHRLLSTLPVLAGRSFRADWHLTVQPSGRRSSSAYFKRWTTREHLMPFYALQAVGYMVPIVVLLLLHRRLEHKAR